MSVRKEKMVEIDYKRFDTHVEIYNSAEEVVKDCASRHTRISGYEVTKISKDWCGVTSYAEALNLMKDGYQPVVETLSSAIKVTPREGKRISFNNNVQGFAPVVPLALKCVPNSMVDMRMKPIKSKVIDVYYDMTASCMTEPEQFIKAGKYLLGAIIELEKSGYRFNLYAVQTYYCDSKKSVDMLCVKVKSSDKPLDLKRMSFPLTHPAFFRVIGFDWEGKSPITRDIGYTRGKALGYNHSKETLNKLVATLFGTTACYVSCAKFIKDGYNQEELKEVFTNAGQKTRK